MSTHGNPEVVRNDFCHNYSYPWISKVQDPANKMASRQLDTQPGLGAWLCLLASLPVYPSASSSPWILFSRGNFPRWEVILAPSFTLNSLLFIHPIVENITAPLVAGDPLAYETQREVPLLPWSSCSRVFYAIHVTLNPERPLPCPELLFQSDGGDICRCPSFTLRLTRSICRIQTLVQFSAHNGYRGAFVPRFVEFKFSSKLSWASSFSSYQRNSSPSLGLRLDPDRRQIDQRNAQYYLPHTLYQVITFGPRRIHIHPAPTCLLGNVHVFTFWFSCQPFKNEQSHKTSRHRGNPRTAA